jgi:transposase-like protein
MERRQFTREFKLEAVRLIKDRGVSYVRASQDLDVHVSQLRDWVKKFSDDPDGNETRTIGMQGSPTGAIRSSPLDLKRAQ